MTTVPSFVSQSLSLLSSGATPPDVRDGQSFVSPGTAAIQTGTMPDNGDLGIITPGTDDIPIPEGYTSGGTVAGDEDLIAENIKVGVNIFGVTGDALLAEGNAVASDVKSGVTFSSVSGSSVGTMPNNGSLGTITPTITDQSIPLGYTDGGTVAGDSDLVAGNIKTGTTIFGVSGSVIQATGTATADKLLTGQTASNVSGFISGTMPNNGALGTITPTTTDQSIPLGYTSGGTVAGSANLLAGNIRLGVGVFGVTGTLDPGTQTGGDAIAADVLTSKTFTNDSGVQTGSMPNRGAVTITPSGSSQTIQNGYHNGSGTVSAVTFDASKVLTGTTIAGTAGTMTDNGSLGTITPGTTNQSIAAGYTSGGTVSGDADLTAGNIKDGVNIFGVVGTLIAGKRFSTGTILSTNGGGSGLPFSYVSGSVNNRNYVTATGLSFKPSIVFLIAPSTNDFILYEDTFSDGLYPITVKTVDGYMNAGASAVVSNYKGDTNSASVVMGSFLLPTSAANGVSHDYIAIE